MKVQIIIFNLPKKKNRKSGWKPTSAGLLPLINGIILTANGFIQRICMSIFCMFFFVFWLASNKNQDNENYIREWWRMCFCCLAITIFCLSKHIVHENLSAAIINGSVSESLQGIQCACRCSRNMARFGAYYVRLCSVHCALLSFDVPAINSVCGIRKTATPGMPHQVEKKYDVANIHIHTKTKKNRKRANTATDNTSHPSESESNNTDAIRRKKHFHHTL